MKPDAEEKAARERALTRFASERIAHLATASPDGRPHIVDAIKNGEVSLVFNTTEGAKAVADSKDIRRTALLHHIPYYTTLAGAVAVTRAIKALKADILKVAPLQAYVGRAS